MGGMDYRRFMASHLHFQPGGCCEPKSPASMNKSLAPSRLMLGICNFTQRGEYPQRFDLEGEKEVDQRWEELEAIRVAAEEA